MAKNTNHQTRVLIAARLSVAGDRAEESRIERDEECAREWAAAAGYEVVTVTRDRGVSGGVSPFKRPSLGPWLTDADKIRRYDVIVASTIDRFGRSARDLDALKLWAEENGKKLIVLKPDLVWPVPSGAAGSTYKILWGLLADLAEIERDIITERIAGGIGKAKANGAFIGKPTWGFRSVGQKYNRTLEPDPALEPVLRELIERAMAGAGFRELARWLDTTGHRSPSAGKPVKGKGGTTTASELWSPTSVAQILRSTDLKGIRVDAAGRTTHRFAGLLSAGKWNDLQAKLPKGQRGPVTSETTMLTGIARCEKCGGPLYRIAAPSVPGGFNYRCKGTDQAPSTCGVNVPVDDLDAWVDRWFTEDGPFAGVEIVETTIVPGEDHTAEADDLKAEIAGLDIDGPDYVATHADLVARLRAVQARPSEPDQIIERPTGQTVGDVWAGLTQAQRRAYLLATGMEVRVLSSGTIRKTPGAEIRYPVGDPHKVIGTLHGIVETAA
jgi:DNA invertase Pin-like site-specific DNA recombinase